MLAVCENIVKKYADELESSFDSRKNIKSIVRRIMRYSYDLAKEDVIKQINYTLKHKYK